MNLINSNHKQHTKHDIPPHPRTVFPCGKTIPKMKYKNSKTFSCLEIQRGNRPRKSIRCVSTSKPCCKLVRSESSAHSPKMRLQRVISSTGRGKKKALQSRLRAAETKSHRVCPLPPVMPSIHWNVSDLYRKSRSLDFTRVRVLVSLSSSSSSIVWVR